MASDPFVGPGTDDFDGVGEAPGGDMAGPQVEDDDFAVQ